MNTLTNQHPNRVYATMEVDGRRTKFQLDTGATCNVLRKSDFGTAVNLKETNQILSCMMASRLNILGSVKGQ